MPSKSPPIPALAAAGLLLLAAVLIVTTAPPRVRRRVSPQPVNEFARLPFVVAPLRVRYDVTMFGTALTAPDGKRYYFHPSSLNERGDLLGKARSARGEPGTRAAFDGYLLQLHNGRMLLLNDAPANSQFWQIWGLSNDKTPRVVAAARVGGRTGAFHRFVGQNGIWRDEGTLPGEPVAGNTRGDLAVMTSDNKPVLCRRGSNGATVTITPLDIGRPDSLSDQGRMAGRSGPTALVWDEKGRATIVPPGAAAKEASFIPQVINDRGDFFLRVAFADSRIGHLLWSDGQTNPLFSKKEDFSGGGRIFLNNRREIAGIGVIAGRVPWSHAAYLWKNGRFYDLNDALPSGSDWRLRGVGGFNDRGQILAYGWNGKESREFLLTPRK